MKDAAITVLICLVATSVAYAQGVDLRGPALQTGDTIVTTSQTKSSDGYVILTPPSLAYTVEGRYSITIKAKIKKQITKAEGGEPTAVSETFLESAVKTTTHVGINGKLEGEPSHSTWSWKGTILASTKADGAWQTKINGVRRPVDYTYLDARLVYPAKSVEVGAKWSIKDNTAAGFFRQCGLYYPSYVGRVELELLEIKDTKRGRVAVIGYQIKGTGERIKTLPDRSKVQQSAFLTGEGRINRSLTEYTDTRTFKGELEQKNIHTTASNVTEEKHSLLIESKTNQSLFTAKPPIDP